MNKPNGAPANNMDPLLTLNAWAHHLDAEDAAQGQPKRMIFAGLGKPSYPLNSDLAHAATDYWQLHGRSGDAIDYGLASGDADSRRVMVAALSRWYAQPVREDEIVFTVGGISALKSIFAVLNAAQPGACIVTPSPYYPYYANPGHGNTLLLCNVMDEPGYRLTAAALQKTIDAANAAGTDISAFLLCDPCNPVGSVMGLDGWRAIGAVLESTPAHIYVIVDEAYAELVFADPAFATASTKHVSLLTACPGLRDRLVLIRSATKALSASGERMALVVCFDPEVRSRLEDDVAFSYVHVPCSLQHAYAHALDGFDDDKRRTLTEHYRVRVVFVQQRLRRMGAQMPDAAYKVEGTFYVMADLSILLGSALPPSSARALGRAEGGVACTDRDICYALLWQERVMVSPLSFFGAPSERGYVRITCTGSLEELTALADRLEAQLQRVQSGRAQT